MNAEFDALVADTEQGALAMDDEIMNEIYQGRYQSAGLLVDLQHSMLCATQQYFNSIGREILKDNK